MRHSITPHARILERTVIEEQSDTNPLIIAARNDNAFDAIQLSSYAFYSVRDAASFMPAGGVRER